MVVVVDVVDVFVGAVGGVLVVSGGRFDGGEVLVGAATSAGRGAGAVDIGGAADTGGEEAAGAGATVEAAGSPPPAVGTVGWPTSGPARAGPGAVVEIGRAHV